MGGGLTRRERVEEDGDGMEGATACCGIWLLGEKRRWRKERRPVFGGVSFFLKREEAEAEARRRGWWWEEKVKHPRWRRSEKRNERILVNIVGYECGGNINLRMVNKMERRRRST